MALYLPRGPATGRLRKSFRSQDHLTRDLDPPVAMRTRDSRQNLRNHASGKTLATPDAIHLATASIYSAEFWTFDAGKKDKKYLRLLELSGDEKVGKLKICKPWVAALLIALQREKVAGAFQSPRVGERAFLN